MIVIFPGVQTRTRGLREVKLLVQSHTASGRSWDLNPSCLGPESLLVTDCYLSSHEHSYSGKP